jgi:hypothetical protein
METRTSQGMYELWLNVTRCRKLYENELRLPTNLPTVFP